MNVLVSKLGACLLWSVLGVAWALLSFSVIQWLVDAQLHTSPSNKTLLLIFANLARWIGLGGLLYLVVRTSLLNTACFVISLGIALLIQIILFHRKETKAMQRKES